MQPRSVEERLTMLERQLQELRDLPERMTKLESQIVQLRQDINGGFSAIGEKLEATGRQMRLLHEDTIARIATMGEGRR